MKKKKSKKNVLPKRISLRVEINFEKKRFKNQDKKRHKGNCKKKALRKEGKKKLLPKRTEWVQIEKSFVKNCVPGKER